MPNNTLEKWEEKQLKDICDFHNGLWTGKKEPFIECNVIRNANFTKDFKLNYDNVVKINVEERQFQTRELEYGDLILEKSGGGPNQPVGRVVIFDKHEKGYSFSNFTSSIRIKNKDILDFRFLYLYLCHCYLSGMTTKMQKNSTGIRNLLFDDYKNISVPIPNISEQQRIVGILDKAFENIEKAKQNALQNLNNAKELFESCLDELFTKNTDNWNKYKVKDLCEYAKEQGHYNLPYVGMEHIKSSAAEFIGTLDNTEVKSTTFHFDKGIILYGRLRPYLRKVILTTFEGHCSTELFPIKVNDKVNNKFLMYWLLSQRITDKINATWTGARMPRANMNKVLEFDISIPSIMEQQKIVVQLDKLQEQTKKLKQIYEQKIKDLDELKQSILQKAFNGEL